MLSNGHAGFGGRSEETDQSKGWHRASGRPNPSYQRVIAAEGHTRAGELAVIGDEQTIAAAVQRYFDAGATEVMFSQPNLSTPADRLRTWEVLGQLT